MACFCPCCSLLQLFTHKDLTSFHCRLATGYQDPHLDAKGHPYNSQEVPNFPPVFTISTVHSAVVCVNFIPRHHVPANCSRTVYLHIRNLQRKMMLKESLFGCSSSSGHLMWPFLWDSVCICLCSLENFPSSLLPFEISAKKWTDTSGYQPWLVSCFFFCTVESYSFLQAFCKVFYVCQVGRTINGSFSFPYSFCSFTEVNSVISVVPFNFPHVLKTFSKLSLETRLALQYIDSDIRPWAAAWPRIEFGNYPSPEPRPEQRYALCWSLLPVGIVFDSSCRKYGIRFRKKNRLLFKINYCFALFLSLLNRHRHTITLVLNTKPSSHKRTQRDIRRHIYRLQNEAPKQGNSEIKVIKVFLNQTIFIILHRVILDTMASFYKNLLWSSLLFPTLSKVMSNSIKMAQHSHGLWFESSVLIPSTITSATIT